MKGIACLLSRGPLCHSQEFSTISAPVWAAGQNNRWKQMVQADWDGQQDYADYLEQRYGLGGAQEEVRSGVWRRFSARRPPTPLPPLQLARAGERRLSR